MDHSPLISLPDELILSILEQFDSSSDLCSFARTSRRFCNIAEPLIYARIFIRTALHAKAILRALESNQQRAQAIISFEARCKYTEFPEVTLCSKLIRLATNLREYVLESPFCNNQRWRTDRCRRVWPDAFDDIMSVFESATPRGSELSSGSIAPPLQNLTTLVLHLNGVDGEELWTCRAQDCYIFVLPSLLDLTISSAVFDIDVQDVLHAHQSTSLRKLAFEECRFSISALTSILSLPTALCSLHLGETRWTEDIPPDWKALIRNPMAFCAALSQQKHSLQYLKYTVGRDGLLEASEPTDGSFHGFADFSALNSVVLDPTCSAIERILYDSFTAPPSLQHLTVYRNLDAAPMASTWRVQTLDVVKSLAYTRLPHWNNNSTWAGDRILAETIELARGAQQTMTHLRVWKETTRRRFVPPLLYGEGPTRAKVIYDSSIHKDPTEVFQRQSWWITRTLDTGAGTDDDDSENEDESDDSNDDFDTTDEDSDNTDDDEFDDGFEEEDDMDLE